MKAAPLLSVTDYPGQFLYPWQSVARVPKQYQLTVQDFVITEIRAAARVLSINRGDMLAAFHAMLVLVMIKTNCVNG